MELWNLPSSRGSKAQPSGRTLALVRTKRDALRKPRRVLGLDSAQPTTSMWGSKQRSMRGTQYASENAR